MPKRIVLFSDGTGNSSAKAQKTNVWRLFQALDQTRIDQIAKYDDGVGTSSNKYLAAIGGAVGWGLKRNVLDLYKFVCRNYEHGDTIYGFGFSRGAFTIRVLVDLIATEGLVTSRSEEELNRNAAAAYRHYRSKSFPSWSPVVLAMRWLRDAALWAKDRIKGYRSYAKIAEDTAAANRRDIRIRFIGLWDTVEAYGMPNEELKRGIDWVIWPMLFGDLVLSPKVERACHALSLDDERKTFHPLIWDEVVEADMVAKGRVAPGRITQVWFAGVHCNVGGGYPEDQLALVPLNWMIDEAVANGLVLDPGAVAQLAVAQSPYARLYDSRAGLGSYYRYAPRQIHVRLDPHKNRILPIVHGSVVMRMAYGSDYYSPISLPHEFWVLAPDGELLPMEGAPLSLQIDSTKRRAASARPAARTTAAVHTDKSELTAAIDKLARPDRQAVRLVWDTVFWRQCLYFLTVALTGVLAAYPLLGGVIAKVPHALLHAIPMVGADLAQRWSEYVERLNQESRGPISNLVDAASGFIPSYAQPWTKAFVEHPVELALIIAAIIGCLSGSTILQGRIRDRARLAWHKDFHADYATWLSESQRGWRNGVLLALAVAIALLAWALVRGVRNNIVVIELAVLVAMLAGLWGLRALGQRRVSQPGTPEIHSTFALSTARSLRNNRLLRGIHKWVFKRAVPIVFALTLLAAGGVLANRALFDGVSAAGYFCTGSPGVGDEERTGSRAGFGTDQMCWPSGLVLKAGRHYRITLTTPGDWFDRTIRADVAGFPADSLRLASATPLKRWWRQDWLKPIVRIGEIGNDEYVLEPAEPFEAHSYPACTQIRRETNGHGVRAKIRDDVAQELMRCAPTPDGRKSVTAEIRARTTGELFVYVNDAVLMWPGRSDQFIRNNSGTGTVVVERISASPQPTR